VASPYPAVGSSDRFIHLTLPQQSPYATIVLPSVAVLAGGPGGLYWLVPGTVFPILVALFAAWVLLVEINR
jgi:hypothetical protein